MIEIKNRWTQVVLFRSESAETLARAVVEAVGRGANLHRANLSDADLSGANLSGANLSGANLSGANLGDANLGDANLHDADLSGADLSGANLSGANLGDANLHRANLSDADLSGANLSDADLSGANLGDANLGGIDLAALTVPSLHRRMLAEIESGRVGFSMTGWHCGTTHCRAGLCVVLAGKAGSDLEIAFGPCAAGAIITALSAPGIVPNFYANDADALASIREAAEKEPAL